jgi:hypothetical protein
MSPDIDKCHLGAKATPAESYCSEEYKARNNTRVIAFNDPQIFGGYSLSRQ